MQLEQLNFHHLFYFWRVAKVGHLTRAAQELHTSQSALSAQIRQLEERLGEVLFSREGRRLVLTDTGQLVLAYAENIFGLSQEMLGRLQGRSEGITRRLVQHQLDVVFANETVPSDLNRPLHCHYLGSQAISLVGAAHLWKPHSLRLPDDLDGLDIALPGPRSALRGQFDALCASAGVTPRLRAEVDDMAMLRLIARDSGWLTVLPEVVVQDELQSGSLVCVGQSTLLQEQFYAITTPHRHHIELLDRLLEAMPQNL